MLSVKQEKIVDNKDIGEDEGLAVTFEETLDQYIYQQPKRGQILKGEIEAIDQDAIILDVGLKRAAIVPGREVSNLDDAILTDLSIGDMIPIKVTHTPIGDQDLLVSIDAAQEFQCWQKAKDCLAEDQLLELKVTGSNRGGLLVAFEKLEGFVPNSHIPALKKVFDPQKVHQYKLQMKGLEIEVKALDVDPENEKLLFSALEAQREIRQERLQSLEVGEVITGKVVNVVDFGLFVDLGGIDGLVHISQLDWHNVDHPSQVAKAGDDIEVQVIDIDMDRERVGLSRKALLPGPWDEIESKYVPGSLVEVEITNVVDFGAFGQLPEGVQGLIHKTELGYTAPDDVVEALNPGSKVLVRILRINTERERISLSMRQVPMEKQLDWLSSEFDPEITDDVLEP
jgi:small subunit ribosomal protein S1